MKLFRTLNSTNRAAFTAVDNGAATADGAAATSDKDIDISSQAFEEVMASITAETPDALIEQMMLTAIQNRLPALASIVDKWEADAARERIALATYDVPDGVREIVFGARSDHNAPPGNVGGATWRP